MIPLHKNIRFWVIIASLTASIGIYGYVRLVVPAGPLQATQLSQIYALTALTLLYFALLAGPFCFAFRHLPHRGWYLRSRRALGVSAFYFSCLHAYQAFFHQLGGFSGLGFLTPRYLIAIGFSLTALLLLATLASTSFDRMIKWLTYRRWKLLHRLAYVIGVLVLLHAALIGTHFGNLRDPIPFTFFLGTAFLLILQARRIDFHLQRTFPHYFPRHVALGITILLLIVYLSYVLISEQLSLQKFS